MNNSNTRFLSLASLSLFLGLAPIACGSDDEPGTNPGTAGTAGRGGTSSTAGTGNGENGGEGGSQPGGGSGGTGGSNLSGSGGDLNLGGEVGNGFGGAGEGGMGGMGGEAAAPKTRLRVVHASPSAPAVDIYVKGATTAAVENVGYGKATEFLEVDAGTIAFDLRAAGADADAEPAFTSDELTLEADSEYTLVAAGNLGDDDEDTAFRILPLQHDFDASETGIAQVRVVHATTAWEDVDIDLASTDDVDVSGLSRFGNDGNLALATTSTQDVSFVSGEDVVSELVLPRLASKSEVFVIATGNPGLPFRSPANGFALLVVDQAGKASWVKENPWVHALHASDIGTVDLYQATAPNVRLANNVAAGELAAFQVPASTTGYTLKAVEPEAVDGSASGLASGSTSTLVAGEHYLGYISGTAIRTVKEQFDLAQPTKALLRGVHAVKAGQIAGQLDFGLVTGGVLTSALISGVGPAAASAEAGVAVDPADITLGAALTTTDAPYATLALTGANALAEGERDFVLLTGATTGTAKLYVVNTAVPGWTVR
jgi:hypothetical protein